ncbi:MAG: hypothetical protein ACOVQE_10920 [Chitinophagaceae bacterium]
MRLYFTCLIIAMCFTAVTKAQQKVEKQGMTYVFLSKPNNIIYKDTVYEGAAQFKQLFLKVNDPLLLAYYKRHQTNKILGTTLSTIGSIGMIVGIRNLSDKSTSTTAGWVWIGAGLATSVTGGYLTTVSKINLFNAVQIFNRKYGYSPTAAIGLTNTGGVGLTVQF